MSIQYRYGILKPRKAGNLELGRTAFPHIMLFALICAASSLSACTGAKPIAGGVEYRTTPIAKERTLVAVVQTPDVGAALQTLLPPTRAPGEPVLTPTPDPSRGDPEIRQESLYHSVQPGDTLSQLAFIYSVGVSQISAANGLIDPNLLEIGQLLTIPAPVLQPRGLSLKIIPDSEFVFGPVSALYDMRRDLNLRSSILQSYEEEVDGRMLDGFAVVQEVAASYSINPQLLLTVLEYQSGWLSKSLIEGDAWLYPLGYIREGREGLYRQLSWAADQLNLGYYLWRAGWLGPLVFADGSVAIPGSGLNAGTLGVHYLYAQLYPYGAWRATVEGGGVAQTFRTLFGDPFERSIEPLVPTSIAPPPFQLPFERGAEWSFTGGPHSAWGSGAAWAALDFAPPGDAWGCVTSEAWVVASADGWIVRAHDGQVIQDLDGDGLEQTGWVLLYLHIEGRDRVLPGTYVSAGDRIGHPSCEGGVATGTHLHIARKYNGEWIPADTGMPFQFGQWVTQGGGAAYDGFLTDGDITIEACACRSPQNQVSH